jgi:HD-GYP domain-containing protein (c-di-GMP phosphodiesterase class II)
MPRLLDLVPRGRTLDDGEWRTRHRTAAVLTVASAVAGTLYGVARGVSPQHLIEHALPLLPLLAAARVPALGRRVRSSGAALALMLAAALVVHAAGGATEAHFLFFIFVPVVALYADWVPLALAVGFVFAHHLVLGLVAPEEVFAPSGPPVWERAAIHSALVLLACGVSLVEWHIGESRLHGLRHEVVDRSADLRRALSEVDLAHAETARRLSMAVESRDNDTGAHIDRIGERARALAVAVGLSPRLAETLRYAAPLHDVGKVAVPDAVLLKPGPLTPEERAVMETHAHEGHRLLRGSSSPVLELGATIAWTHHEKWDGSGYPRGLSGEAIPVEGRIVAIVDVFDALTSDRVYRRALPLAEALEIVRRGRGTHFDPEILDAFLGLVERGDTRAPAASA